MDVDLSTHDGTGTTIPIVVANMTAISGRRMAETIARRGGMAVIPQDIPIEVVSDVIKWVKSRHTFFDTPVTLSPTETVADAVDLINKRAHGALIVVEDGKPVGIVTEADCERVDRFTQLQLIMSKDLVTVPDSIEPREAFEFLNTQRRKLAPVVDKKGKLVGILTRTAALRATLYQPAIDTNKNLRIACAVGVNGDVAAKAKALIAAGADVLVVDTAHGHQIKMIEALKLIRALKPNIPIVAGNVVTAEGTKALIEAGADIDSIIATKIDCSNQEMPSGLVELLRTIARHNDVLDKAVNMRKPHLFATQLLDLANAYNGFYRDCHILVEGVPNPFYLQVSEIARNLLRTGMQGVGIIPIEQM